MVCTISAGTASGYYLAEQTRYYTEGKEAVGRWYAPPSTLGLSNGAEIDDATFERLHSGLDETGRPLTQNADGSHADRVGGYDLTFSAPKSVSVIWALGDLQQRESIEAAHDIAVSKALDMVNDNAAFTRRGKGGARLEAVDLTGAIFRHGEARPTERAGGSVEADPQLHSHAVIFNLAQREDGTWGSIDGRQLYRWKMAAGAVYRAELTSRLQELGHRIERTDEKGLFEVAGVPRAICDEFSGRRHEIVTALKEKGLDSADAPALAAAVTKAGRRSKSLDGGGDRHESWRARAEAAGYRLDLPAPSRGTRLESEPDPAAFLDKLTENQSVFRRQDMVAAVAASLIGSRKGADAVADRVAALLNDKEIVSLGNDAIGQSVYSTRAMIAIEKEVADHAKAMANGGFHNIPNVSPIPELNDEQNAAVTYATRPNRIALVEGAAGSGKTTTLGVIADLYSKAGIRIIGTSTAWRAAKQLGDECRIESRALDSWLAKHSDGQSVFDAKTVLIVDEAGLLSSRQMHALLSATRSAGTKVILTGDQRQMQAIGAGSGLSIVAAEMTSTRINTNRRQQEAWARQAVSQLSRGDAAPALDAFDRHGRLYWGAGRQEALDKAVGLWRNQIQTYPNQSTLVLAKSNADVRSLNAAIRQEFRAMGRLSGNDVIIRAADRSRSTLDLSITKGDRIEFYVRNDAIGVINGSIGTVTRVAPDKNGYSRLTLAIGDRAVTFSTSEIADKKGRARIGHAYATTLYNAQGMTVDRAVVVGTTTMTANQAYVAASRARESTDIVIDQRAVDSELRSKARASGHVRTTGFSADDRKAHLADRWSRREVKETTRSVLQQTNAAAPMVRRGRDKVVGIER